MGALSLKLFGETTDEDIDHILEVIEGLIENDMDEALGPENGLEDGNDGTKSGGGDQGSNASATKSSEKMSAGRKAMISILSVAVVAMVGAFAYRRMNQPNRNEEEEVSDFDRDSDDSLPHTSP